MSDPALSKLLEVDSDLAVQETDLLAQLEAVRARRASLQTVVGIFASEAETTSKKNGSGSAIPAEIKTSAASQTKASRKRKAVEEKDKKTQAHYCA